MRKIEWVLGGGGLRIPEPALAGGGVEARGGSPPIRAGGRGLNPWLLPALLSLPSVPLSAGDPAEDPGMGKVVVDRERGEVRIPCRFVNPTQMLEVFACHESGPTHETVVAFDAQGEEIYRALREAGFRGPEFWNVTSPEDLALVGGDRALVWIRWEWKGEVHEITAEDLLIEEGTALPLFTRGFTFSAEPVLMGDPPRRRIPRAVELTIGGTNRQSATFSMLIHPNDLPEMINWEPAPAVNPRAIDLQGVVESRTPCSLIVRRMKGEAELIEIARLRETSGERRAVRESQVRCAALIDERKGRFEELLRDVRLLLDQNESRPLSEEERKLLSARTLALIASGGRLAAEIRELYLRLWGSEEKFRYRKITKDLGIEPGRKAWAEMAYRSGFKFELAAAGMDREIAALKEGGREGAVGKGALLQNALKKEKEALLIERERRWAGFRLVDEIRPRLKTLDPKAEEYVVRLFRESELRTLAEMRSLRSRAEAARADADELRAQAEGRAEGLKEELSGRRARAEARGRLAEAELKYVDLLEKFRWAENPRDPPEEKAEEEMRSLGKERDLLLAQLKDLRAVLASRTAGPAEDGEEPPDDGKGKPLYPQDLPD